MGRQQTGGRRDESDVVVETIYTRFASGKALLLVAVDVAIVGDTPPLPLVHRGTAQRINTRRSFVRGRMQPIGGGSSASVPWPGVLGSTRCLDRSVERSEKPSGYRHRRLG